MLLAVLDEREGHGYELSRRLDASSAGLFSPQAGTVYPALRKLERDGMVKSRWSEVGGRRRRIYRLTDKGRKALRAQRGSWERFAAAMTRVVAAPDRGEG